MLIVTAKVSWQVSKELWVMATDMVVMVTLVTVVTVVMVVTEVTHHMD